MKIVPSTAYHEAGHAAIAIHLGLGIRRVSIVPNLEYLGICQQTRQRSLGRLAYDGGDTLTKRVEKNMMVMLAGIEAQRKFSRRSLRKHDAQADHRNVLEFAFKLSGSMEEALALVHLLKIRTKQLVDLTFIWNGIKGLAKALMERREISGAETRAIFEASSMEDDEEEPV